MPMPTMMGIRPLKSFHMPNRDAQMAKNRKKMGTRNFSLPSNFRSRPPIMELKAPVLITMENAPFTMKISIMTSAPEIRPL